MVIFEDNEMFGLCKKFITGNFIKTECIFI